MTGDDTDGLTESQRKHYRLRAREERDRRDFVEHLEATEHVHNVSERRHTVDFTIGEYDDYPDTFDDDHLNVIQLSSVSDNSWGVDRRWKGLTVDEVKIHLPAAPESLHEEIDDVLELPDGLGVHYGTGALGGMPAPDGVITPHILHTDPVPFDTARAGVDAAVEAYVDVYNEGERAIKEAPGDD